MFEYILFLRTTVEVCRHMFNQESHEMELLMSRSSQIPESQAINPTGCEAKQTIHPWL